MKYNNYWHITAGRNPEKKAMFGAWTVLRPGIKEREVFLDDVKFIEKRLFCQDCGQEDALLDYMVRHDLWKKVMLDDSHPIVTFDWIGKNHSKHSTSARGGFICLHCFAKRLGRKLTLDDLLPSAAINEKFFMGATMARKEKHAKAR